MAKACTRFTDASTRSKKASVQALDHSSRTLQGLRKTTGRHCTSGSAYDLAEPLRYFLRFLDPDSLGAFALFTESRKLVGDVESGENGDLQWIDCGHLAGNFSHPPINKPRKLR